VQTGRTLCDEVGVGNGRPPNQYRWSIVELERRSLFLGAVCGGDVTAKIVQPKPDELKYCPDFKGLFCYNRKVKILKNLELDRGDKNG
jgi:hypothetical protein